MYIILLLLSTFCVFLVMRLTKGLRESFVFCWLIILYLTYFSTEILSSFFAVNLTTLVIYYSILLLTTAFIVYKKKSSIKYKSLINFNDFSKMQIVVVGIILGYIFILLFIGIYCPPNNWDSMTYHLGRVVHWQQNQSVEHYATHISRQLFNPPLIEYLQLHILILSGNDYFLNVIQLISLVGSIITLSLIIKELGYNLNTQIEVGFVAITIPMAILQATNTKNELSVAFLFIFSVHYLIKLYKNFNQKDAIVLGLSIGLSFVTKSTSYIYLLPVLFIFFIALCFKNFKQAIIANFVAFCIAIIIVSPLYFRNYNSYKNPLGATKNEQSWVVNTTHDWKTLVSNLSRNTFIQLANVRLWGNQRLFLSNGRFHKRWIENLHRKLNIDINNPDTTFGNSELAFNIERDEDYAGNFFHFILSIIAILLLIFLNKYFKLSYLEFLLILSLIGIASFFSIYLKWQPWHGRLHLPIFMFSTLIISVFLSKINDMIRISIFTLLILGSITYLFENQSKVVLFKKPKIFNLTRDEMMFTKKGNQYLRSLYEISDFLKLKKSKNLGLIIDGDTWDYAIFKILKRNNNDLIINHVNVSKENTPQVILDKTPVTKCDYILSNLTNAEEKLIYNNLVFRLAYKNNGFSVFSKKGSVTDFITN